MSRAARARWAVSFADLSLLLLGFFVLLQANQTTRDQALAGLNTYFAGMQAPHQADLPADQLFAPGEALLSVEGKARLLAAARPFADGKSVVRVQSLGMAHGEYRFDAWDLSAARLGAVARALVAGGIAPGRIRIAGLAEPDPDAKDTPKSQVIRLAEAPALSE